MEINLTQDSIVNEQTGQVDTPGEYVENLRSIEVGIQRMDDRIAALKGDLKAARDGREKLVDQLRGAVRDGRVLPLFETPPETDEDDDGFDTKPGEA